MNAAVLSIVNSHGRKVSISDEGLADWPITYEELAPYYTQAEWELGVSG